eukprot:TRINITY_DN7282_c0_g1_i1.p1 TRINITY_DN7282_c0_g1~~TRINITY_DN7282_c0_g1_i1.p1  ORF type:complete len:324 (+),score=103.58 TRINITY_DN7282_c0_g1_i1:220-1191(+)
MLQRGSATSSAGGSFSRSPGSFSRGPEPNWRAHLAFRGQPYRLLHHQHGVAGHVRARVLDVAEIPRETLGRFSPTTRTEANLPSVVLGLGKCWKRTSPALHGGARVAWSREPLALEVVKESLVAGMGVQQLEVQACNRKDIAALGSLDIEPLLLGHADVLDVWVELQPSGRVHLLVEYEPRGLAPQQGDVVYTESFARWPRSVVLPHQEPLQVTDTRGPYVMASYDTASGHRGLICLHRNTLYVVERFSWWDNAVKFTAQPVDALLQTDAGQWAARKARPAIASVCVLVGPLQASCKVAATSLSLAAGAIFHGTMAIAKEHFA